MSSLAMERREFEPVSAYGGVKADMYLGLDPRVADFLVQLWRYVSRVGFNGVCVSTLVWFLVHALIIRETVSWWYLGCFCGGKGLMRPDSCFSGTTA